MPTFCQRRRGCVSTCVCVTAPFGAAVTSVWIGAALLSACATGGVAGFAGFGSVGGAVVTAGVVVVGGGVVTGGGGGSTGAAVARSPNNGPMSALSFASGALPVGIVVCAALGAPLLPMR